MKSILVVDDEKSIRDSIRMVLEHSGEFTVDTAGDGPSALQKVAAGSYDLVLLDIAIPGLDGIRVLERIRETRPSLPVAMVSAHGTVENAMEVARLGAYDFLEKPFDNDRLLILARNATELKELREMLQAGEVILGDSPKIKEVLAAIERVAPTDVRVLITGENGSGKELVARAIHRLSTRNAKPFVEVNCAAIPNELIESELFGHEKGAFTGAASRRIGKFELADRGTVFLDEIGDMSLNAQAKVLRALEEGKIERVGGNELIGVDVRVIAATNKNLPEAIKHGSFREDLYHRLNVIPIAVPPLRERREDIPLLVRAFAADICRRNGMAARTFTEEALRKLQSFDWTGNVRELRNTVERLVILTPGTTIDARHVEGTARGTRTMTDDLLGLGGTFQEFKERAEAAYIKKQLELHDWNVTRTAEALDIQRSHLYNKMKKYGLEKEGME